MKRYWQVVKNTWDEMVTYRFNFSLWRIRVVLQFLTIYYFWFAVMPNQGTIFGYSKTMMLTYILGTTLISAIALSTRTQEIGDNINSGGLSFFLIRPINYFLYWLARDFGDKLMNLAFAVIELVTLYLLLRPPIFLQTHLILLLLTILFMLLGAFLYFLFGCLLGFIGFWSPEVWAPRFIFSILLNFFAGSLFPLDILPKNIFFLFRFSPFPYLLFFPMKLYLGQLSGFEITTGLWVACAWITILFWLTKLIWEKGIKLYAAQGQ